MVLETRQHIHIYCPTVDLHRLRGASAAAGQLRTAPPSLAADMQSSRFEMSFEQAFERLDQLPRMFIELDGSFVWSGQQQGRDWQIDGMLYDREGRLQRIELAGQAPRLVWEQLLNAIGQPADSLALHCLQQQRLIDTAEFLDREL